MLKIYGEEMGSESQISRLKAITVISTVSSFMANMVACTITHPLDLIRTRAFFKFHNKDQNQHYSGVLNGINKIYRKEGFPGFFRGLMPRILRKGLGSVIVWTSYEYLIDKKDAIMKID